jgi:hypothetical protein
LISYDVYGNVGVTPYAGQDAINEHYNEQEAWRNFATSRNVGYIPGTFVVDGTSNIR